MAGSTPEIQNGIKKIFEELTGDGRCCSSRCMSRLWSFPRPGGVDHDPYGVKGTVQYFGKTHTPDSPLAV